MSDLLMDKVPDLRARLQRMKDAPEGPMQAAFKKHVLDTMSDPTKWADGIVPVAWFGLQQFEEGWNAACARPAEEVQKDALKEADALISRIEAFYDGADMFAWEKVREKVRAALDAKDTP